MSSQTADASTWLPEFDAYGRRARPHDDDDETDDDDAPCLDSDPVRIGHFHVLGRIGAGGMGIVYSAYDDELDRRVAIKLLRSTLGVGAELDGPRLRREAQALARLSHPNVVQVYEVGRHDGQMFVAMEYVRGKTLQTWFREHPGPRPWREVLDVYIPAGRGLAAAHSVGLVHRDFKPGNVMLGDDGRVRVLDFGLVRSLTPGGCHDPGMSTQSPHAALGPLALTTSLTMTGDILGTPAYMAPEQYNGRRCDDRTDQFSFCVALFEALYGVRPHPGKTIWEALECGERGVIRRPPAGSRVPAWLHAALCRGLSPDPAARWPSMAALLAELARDHRAPLRRLLGVGVGSIGLALGLWARSAAPSPVEQCEEDNAADPFADILNPSGPGSLAPVVGARIETLAETWRDAQLKLCRQYRGGALSSDAYRRGVACLLPYRTVIVRVGEALTVGGDHPDLTGLPEPAHVAACADPSNILQESHDGTAPAHQEVARIREQLAEARAALVLGRHRDSEALATLSVVDARRLADGPTLAAALYHLASAQEYGPHAASAAANLDEAALLAVRYGLDDLAADIALRRLRVARRHAWQSSEGWFWFEVLRYHLGRLHAQDDPREADAHGYLGDFALARDDLDAASTEYERALAGHAGAPFLRTPALIGLGRVLARERRHAEARRYFEEALRIIEEELGPEHEKVVPPLLSLAESYIEEGSYQPAEDATLRALAVLGDRAESSYVPIAYFNVARIAEARGDLERARPLAEAARRTQRGPGIAADRRIPRRRILDLVGRMTHETGDSRAALAPYLELLQSREGQDPADARGLALAYANAAEIAHVAGADDLTLRFAAAARPFMARLPAGEARDLAVELALAEGPALLRHGRPATAALVLQAALEARAHDETDPRISDLRRKLRLALRTDPPDHPKGR